MRNSSLNFSSEMGMGSRSSRIGSDRSSQTSSRMKRLLSSLLICGRRTSNSNSHSPAALEHCLVSIQQKERAKTKINLIVDEAKQLSTDIISTLPQPIIENILSLLPIREAARTSILSREWRYKWTTLSTLDFPHLKLHVANVKTNGCTYFDYIFQVLLSYQGQIHELILEICYYCDPLGFYILMLHLAKKHVVKKLELYGRDTQPRPVLDLSLFSLQHHLKDLHLAYVRLEDQTIFNINIGSITSLVLDNVLISTQSLPCLLSNCPSLNNLYLHIYDAGTKTCSIMDLFKCIPMIERLTINSEACVYSLDIGLVPQKLSSVLFHLKYFCLERMWFDGGSCLPFLLVLIKCAPNLEKIKLEIVVYDDDHDDDYEEYSVEWEKYSHVWLENLIELEIEDLSNLKVEMEFVKFMLARSPKLNKLSIKVREYGDSEKEKSMMLEALLQAPHASSVLRIIYV